MTVSVDSTLLQAPKVGLMHDSTMSRDYRDNKGGFDEKLNGPRKTPDLGSALWKNVVYRYI